MNKTGQYSEKNQTEEQLYEQLYKRYYPRLFNYSLQFTKNKQVAQDLVHEVFLKLWEKSDNLNHVAVKALLFKMTRNMCLNYIKHLKIVQNVYVDLASITKWEELYRIEFVKDEPHMLIEKEIEQKISDIMQELPDRCREVFVLSRMKGLRNRQIAEQLNISLKTVEKHISQAIRTFKDEFSLFASIQLVILVLSRLY